MRGSYSCDRRSWTCVDLGAVHPSAILRVDAVSLGEEVHERSGLRRRRLADSAARAAEGLALVAHALVDDPAAAPLERDPRLEVGQLVQPSRRLDRELARGVEAQEPDPGLAITRDARTDVQLAEAGDERQRKCAACA